MRRINLYLSLMIVGLFIGGDAYGQSVTVGGRLYDKWWSQAGVETPSGDQPLWITQSTNTRSGADTWRCKECHGWDYKGAAGAYGSGSHFTGFAGVLDAAAQLSAAELTAWLDGTTNPDHDFSAMGADQLPHLARFLSESLVDVAPFIDADKTAIGGDVANGQQLYAVCSGCHGANGTTINFSGDPEDPEFVGTIAAGNPWEFIHKVRLGQPGSDPPMPTAVDLGWSMVDVVDVLAYAQSLPTEKPLIQGFYSGLRVLRSGAPTGGLTKSGSAAGGRAEGLSRSKPLARPLRSWGQVKASVTEEE